MIMASTESLESMWNSEFPPEDDEENALISQSYYYDLDGVSSMMQGMSTNEHLSILNVNSRRG